MWSQERREWPTNDGGNGWIVHKISEYMRQKKWTTVHSTSDRPKMAENEIHLVESTREEERQQIQEFFKRDPQGP